MKCRLATWLVCVGLIGSTLACDLQGPAAATPRLVVGGTVSFRTIQSTIDAAPEGATIEVPPGTYSEAIVVGKPVTLIGVQAIIDGRSVLDGWGTGIYINANDVTVSGFVVQNFARGVLLDKVKGCRIRDNELRFNTSKSTAPFMTNQSSFDGITMVGAHENEITGNFVHDNGGIGLQMTDVTGENLIRSNRFLRNGTQQPQFVGVPGGMGIVSFRRHNTNNQIIDNEIAESAFGVYIGSIPDSGNLIRGNRV